MTIAGPAEGSEAQHLARSHIAVAASTGTAPAPQYVLRAIAGGAVPVTSRLPEYEEALDDGERGLLFEPRDTETLAAQLTRLIGDADLRERLHGRVTAAHDELEWGKVAEQFEELYRRVAARRHAPDGPPAVRKRLAARDFIHVDLHMHTDHSHDCATPVDVLLDSAKAAGLGAIAITDHNEISGALEAAERANGIKVIVAEEVKTADQGEVIGLFIKEKIERGMTLEATIAEIRRQGGLVYVPHPFDRMHAVPDYEHMLDIVEDIDAIEVFNPRVAISSFNEEAARFAAKYRIVAGAGSDSHVAQGLGSVKIKMRDFDGPEEFLESLREADIIRRKQSLLYVQALKFIQTKGPEGPPSRQVAVQRKGAEPGRAKPEEAVPATDDEIREKYLERAIRELNQLTRDIQDCELCPRGNVMPVLGSGHPQADIFLLKFAPRPSEIEEGVAFYGRAGGALMKSFKRLGIDPLTVYGTVFVKCPVGDTDLAAGECRARVLEELAIVQPRMVVVMGEEARVELNELGVPLGRELEDRPGEIQQLTPMCDALFVPDIDASLDDEGAKRTFWRSFRALGDWYADLPPY